MNRTFTQFYKETPFSRLRVKTLLVLMAVMMLTSIHAQITYSFTTAGATGRYGPTQAQLNTAYGSTNLNGAVTTTNGIQLWTVPVTGQYSVNVYGAQGGSGNGKTGGKGAFMSGKFNFTAGQVIQILIGQTGATFNDYYGGGGGSFVVDPSNNPLIIAGGGGGAGGTGGGNGVDAVIGTSGTAGVSGGTGGINGNGGYCINSNAGSGGGFYTDGGGSGVAGAHGIAFVNGGIGGQFSSWLPGGFGGGGNGWNSTGNGGGGGGYSGGGTSGDSYTGGGGGGSFNNGTNQTNTPGFNTGDGKVNITLLEAAALHFDGAGDYVTTTDPNFGTSDFTIETWFKPTNTTGSYLLTTRTGEPGQAGNWWTVQQNGSTVSLEISECGFGGAAYAVYTTPTVVTVGAWNHLAITKSGTQYKFYMNGALVLTSNDGFARNFITGSNILRLGGWPNFNSAWFNGALDEVRIWNVARTQCQISSNMNCEIPTTASGLTRNYHFNQGYPLSPNPTVTVLTDASASAANGNLTNFALTGSISNWITPGGVSTGSTTPASLPVVGLTVTNTVVCSGQTTILNGTGASTYAWTGGVTNGVPFAPSSTLSYTVTGTNTLTGCSSTNLAVQQVSVNSLPVVTASASNSVICNGQTTTLNGSGASTYTWTGGATNGVGFTPASTATYVVTGTNATTGCTNTATQVVTVNPIPNVTASTTNSVICNGQTTTLNGGGASTYTWTGGATNGVGFTPASTATYVVTGTSAAGCTNTATQAVTVNPLPNVTASTTNSVICNGQTTTLNGGGASTYTWTGGATNGVGFTPASTATYVVTGTNATTGCTNTATQAVTVNALPNVTASATNSVICNGQTTTLNGGGASTYTWTGGVTNGSPFSPSSTLDYTVSGTNGTTGCTNTAVQGVTVNPLPVVTASISNAVICEGATTTLNGGGADTYTWTGSVTDGVAFAPLTSDTYTVTGTNTLTGCSNTAVESVTVNTLPVVTASISNSVVCEGTSITVNGGGADTYTWTGNVTDGVAFTPTITGSYTVTGTNTLTGCTNTNLAVADVTVNANPAVTAPSGVICIGGSYTITPSGASTYTISGGSNIVTPASTDSYTITGESAEGCFGTAVVTVSVQTSLTVSIAGPAAICNGQTANLTANGATSYSWNTGSSGNTIAPTPTTTTTYSVVGSSGSCSDSTTVTVTVNANPTITAATSATMICIGDPVILTANGASTYTWNTSATGATITETPSLTVTYTVTGEDANGCTSMATVQQSVDACTGIEAHSIVNTIKVYPNPGSGLATIELYSNAQVIIVNVIGDIISNENLSAGKHQLDIREVANGIYFVKVIHNKNQQTIKLIKQ